jgi:hypothetical protein
MPWNGKNEKLRGWKRYPARGAGRHGAPRPTPQQARNPQTLSRLRPLWLGDRLRFEGVIRFHNLRPVELGALVWAIEWGGNDRLRHGLGMGKPFGWGQVALRLGRDHERSRIVPNDPSAPAEPVADTLARCQDAFVAEMDRWLASKGVNTGWAQSEPIRRLRAMADPANAERNAPLRHMTLDPDGKANQFADAKKAGLVLQEYWEAGETPQITPPMLTDMKGLAGGGGGGRPGAGGTARKGGGASATGGGLFRKGERVTNIEEGEVVVVLADQAGPNAPVTIQYEDGMEDAVPAGILARR